MGDDLGRIRPLAVPRSSDNRIKTYRYLRLGMVLVIVLLAVAVLIERVDDGCFQTSLSAYYHTSIQPVFVGTLVTIAACLVIIRGYTDWEDTSLNLAGMLAAIVAFVPAASRRSPSEGCPQEAAAVDIDNDVTALLIVGSVAVLVAAYFVARSWGHLSGGWRGTKLSRALGLAMAAVIVGGAWAWYGLAPTSFKGGDGINAHFTAAVAMLLFFGLVVLLNALPIGRAGDQGPHRSRFVAAYWAILSLMAVSVVVYLIAEVADWSYAVLFVETAVILLFAAFWVIQTIELDAVDEDAVPFGATA
jgi:hypothetical protein